MSSGKENQNGKVWGLAAVAGIIAFFVLKVLVSYSFAAALLLAVLIAVLVAILLWIGFYRDAETPAEIAKDDTMPSEAAKPAFVSEEAETAATEEPVAEVVAAPETPKPAPKPATAKAKPPAKPKAETNVSKMTASSLMGDAGAAMVNEKKAENSKPKPKRKPVAKNGKPPVMRKARATGADDLKLIKGVGPKLETTLNELGFYHFDQIAGWRKKEIEWVDERLKFKGRIERDEWTKQCKALARARAKELSAGASAKGTK
ncbi:MAG: NADH:quinone oxidoreductase [Marinosulfonomonas sp.]